MDSLTELVDTIHQFSHKHNVADRQNPYCQKAVNLNNLATKWSILQEQIPKRHALLQQEVEQQNQNNKLREQFANIANQIGPWIQKRSDKITKLTTDMKGTIDDAIRKLNSHHEDIEKFFVNIQKLEKVNTKIVKERIFNNPYTNYALEGKT